MPSPKRQLIPSPLARLRARWSVSACAPCAGHACLCVCVYMCAAQTQPGPERNDPFVGFELCQPLPEKLGFNGWNGGAVVLWISDSRLFVSPRSLTAAQASELMERLTRRLNLHAGDLTQLSYVPSNHATTTTTCEMGRGRRRKGISPSSLISLCTLTKSSCRLTGPVT